MFLVHWIVNWLLGALALWLVAQIIPGIRVRDFGAALTAWLGQGFPVQAVVAAVALDELSVAPLEFD